METKTKACGCKVQRKIDSYGLSDLNQRMVDWWTISDEEKSLRDIATSFNHELLREEMERNGLDPLDGEVANTYRLLTGDDVNRGVRTQTRKRLEQQGIAVDRLVDDFVSYQSIYRHLNDCLGTEYSKTDRSPETRREKATERIFSLKSRTEAVTSDTLTQLVENDALDVAGFDVLVEISMTCNSCHRRYSIDEIIENEGCTCQQSDAV